MEVLWFSHFYSTIVQIYILFLSNSCCLVRSPLRFIWCETQWDLCINEQIIFWWHSYFCSICNWKWEWKKKTRTAMKWQTTIVCNRCCCLDGFIVRCDEYFLPICANIFHFSQVQYFNRFLSLHLLHSNCNWFSFHRYCNCNCEIALKG